MFFFYLQKVALQAEQERINASTNINNTAPGSNNESLSPQTLGTSRLIAFRRYEDGIVFETTITIFFKVFNVF